MSKKDIHIVLSSSNDFIEHCATTMASILYNLSNDYFAHFYILTYDLTKKSKRKLFKLSKIKQCIIEYPKFNEKMLDMFDGIKIPSHVTKMTYARILIPDILPYIDKAIFIDSDTIVRTDISKLFEIDVENYYFAMVEDACGKNNSKTLWGDSSILYFNCGIMLINSKKLREDRYLNLMEQQIQQNKDKYIICDQDVLNDTFKGRILPLNIGWNFHHEKFYKLKWYKPDNIEEYLKVENNPLIVHCTGPRKPWLVAINNKYCAEYYFYCKLTKFYKKIKLQKFTIDGVKYKNLLFREKNIYYSEKSEKSRKHNLFGITLNANGKFFREECSNGVYSLFFLKKLILQKKDVEDEQFIKLMGITIYKNKVDKIKAIHTDLDGIREEIFNLKRLIDKKSMEIEELSYRYSYIPLSVYNHHHKVLPPYKNIYRDKSIVICGSGPTLNKYIPIKNAIHIGLNRVYENENINLDYIFAWDFDNLSNDDPEFYKRIERHPAKKICGIYLNDQLKQINENLVSRLDALTLYSSSLYGLGCNKHDPHIHYDIERYPLMDFGSVAFGAFHFALYTGAQKIYLVGIDNSLNGYFKKEHNQKFLQVEDIYRGWLNVKKFMQKYYPDVEVISINPVGLKGIFNDKYN